MSGYEQKDMSGSLFKNEKKSDKHPDYKGSCVIGGVEYWQSVWVKKDRNGNSYMSQSFTAKNQSNSTPVKPEGSADGLPF